MDIPCAPILADITVDGKPVKAVAQPTKQNFLYVFDRVTGKPIWPIEEKPVPQGDVPGEWYSKTQPFPSKPPAYDRQGVSLDDLIDFTPELHEEAVKLVSRYQIGPLFTPPALSKPDGPLATLASPGPLGGANWPGGAFDPETHRLYVFSQSGLGIYGLVPPPDAKVSDMNYIQGIARPPATEAGAAGGRGRGGAAGFAADVARLRGVTVQGLPLLKPPYGRITAFDMDKGEKLWQIAHGETPDNIKKQHGAQRPHHPAHRTPRHHRNAGDQDPGNRRRTRNSRPPRTAAAPCSAHTTRKPEKNWARSICRLRKAARQ